MKLQKVMGQQVTLNSGIRVNRGPLISDKGQQVTLGSTNKGQQLTLNSKLRVNWRPPYKDIGRSPYGVKIYQYPEDHPRQPSPLPRLRDTSLRSVGSTALRAVAPQSFCFWQGSHLLHLGGCDALS